ncbi:hypothetical protein DIPPA_20147 [Diplonema papillatum]|nr:hypothetical protein DIPPA_20147 [Diplonema papillatum]
MTKRQDTLVTAQSTTSPTNPSRRSTKDVDDESHQPVVLANGSRTKGDIGLVFYRTMAGVGVVTLPYALQHTGLYQFPAFLCGVALCSQYGCVLQARALDYVAREDLGIVHLGKHSLGTLGYTLALLSSILNTWGRAVVSLRFIAEAARPMLRSHNALGHSRLAEHWFVILCVCCVVYPLTFCRFVAKAEWLLLFTPCAVIALLSTSAAKAIDENNGFSHVDHFEAWPRGFVAISVLVHMFNCDSVVFLGYRSMAGYPGEKAECLTQASCAAIVAATLVFAGTAYAACSAFAPAVGENDLRQFHGGYDAMKIIFAVTAACELPGGVSSCADAVERDIVPYCKMMCRHVGCCGGGAADLADEEERSPLNTGYPRPKAADEETIMSATSSTVDRTTSAVASLVLIILAGVAAWRLDNLYSAIAYLGASTGMCQVAILPPLLYLCTVRKHFPAYFILASVEDFVRPLLVEAYASARNSIAFANMVPEGANEAEDVLSTEASERVVPNGHASFNGLVDQIAAPPPLRVQWLAFMYLILGCAGAPVLLYIAVRWA